MLVQAVWDSSETSKYRDPQHRFLLFLETFTCPDLTPHEGMRQEKCVAQYKPLAAKDANCNWYKVKDHEVREVGLGNSKQRSVKSTNLSQPQNDGARRGRLTIHGAMYASDATKAKRHRSASSTSKVELHHPIMDRQHDVEDTELEHPVFEESSINDPNEMEISSEVNGGTSSPDYREKDGKKRCFCQNAAYGDMVACDSPECPHEWFHFECGSWFCQECTGRGHASITSLADAGFKVLEQ